MASCPFCEIVAGRIPAVRVLEDGHWVAFADLHPQAPVHVLVVPRVHLASLDAARDEDRDLLGRLLLGARAVARSRGLETGGYRVLTNSGADAGQTVLHLHLHVLGGAALRSGLG